MDMQTLGYVVLLFILVITLIKSADLVVHSLRRLSQETHTKVFILMSVVTIYVPIGWQA